MSEIIPNTAGIEVVETSKPAPKASKAPEQPSAETVSEVQEQTRQQIQESGAPIDESLNQNQKETDSQKPKSKYDSLSDEDWEYYRGELDFKQKAAEKIGVPVVRLGMWLWTPKGIVFLKDSPETKALLKLGYEHHDQKNQCYFRNEFFKCGGGSDSGRKIKTMEEIEEKYLNEQEAIAA